MSGIAYPPCICPADACFRVQSGAYCKHAGKVLATFADQRGNRFKAYVVPGSYRPGQHIQNGLRCVSVPDPS